MEALKADDKKLLTDLEVVKKVVHGEKELFEVLMRRNNQTLYRVVRNYLPNDGNVEDIMQETYLKAYENLQQFRGTSSFSTWLIRIGINEALMFLRSSKKRQKVIPINGAQEKVNHQLYKDPERKLIQHEMKMTLEKAIDNLPDKYRIIYIMKEVEDMDFPAIAGCLNITENNVKVRLHRAKMMLKDALYELSSGVEIFTFGNSRCDRIVMQVMNKI